MTTAPAPAQKTNLATIVTPGANLLVPEPEILQPGDKEKHAASLNDKELIAHVRTTLHNLRDDLPYLREARNRFAQPGRRVPVEGQPTWKEWVEANLHVKIRTVQRWLEEPKPKKDKKTRQVKPLKDWPDAMRKANDFVAAVKRLQAKTPVKGVDMLIPALRELAAITGCQLVEPTHTPEPKLEPTVDKEQAPEIGKKSNTKLLCLKHSLQAAAKSDGSTFALDCGCKRSAALPSMAGAESVQEAP
jgi:hypothetical protein